MSNVKNPLTVLLLPSYCAVSILASVLGLAPGAFGGECSIAAFCWRFTVIWSNFSFGVFDVTGRIPTTI